MNADEMQGRECGILAPWVFRILIRRCSSLGGIAVAGKSIVAILILTVILTCGLAVGAHAAGGVCLDDLQITNDGKMAFSESFDSRSLRGWSSPYDVTLIQTNPGGYYLHLNKHHIQSARAWHKLTVNSAGLVELSAKVYVTPPEEQYLYKQKAFSLMEIVLYSGNSRATMSTIVNLNPKEKANRMSISLQKMQRPTVETRETEGKTNSIMQKMRQNSKEQLKGYGATTSSPVIQPKTWTTLTVKLDPKTTTTTVLVNGKSVLTQPYDPNLYQSLNWVLLGCTYGDGAQIGK